MKKIKIFKKGYRVISEKEFENFIVEMTAAIQGCNIDVDFVKDYSELDESGNTKLEHASEWLQDMKNTISKFAES